MAYAALFFVVLAAVSGLHIRCSESWSPIYIGELLVHPLAGLAGLFLLRSQLAAAAKGDQPVLRGRRAVGLLRLGAGLALATGVLLLPIPGLPRSRFLSWIHTALSNGLAGAIVLALLLAVLRGGGVAHVGGVNGYKLLRFTLVAFGVAVAVVLGVDCLTRTSRPSFTFHLTSVLAARKTLPSDPVLPSRTAGLLDAVERCGVDSRCHLGMVEEFRRSAHDTSYSAPYMRKNLGLLESEIGGEHTAMCAGCHVPVSIFRGETEYRKYEKIDNTSCPFCHSVAAVFFPEDRRVSSYTLRPNVAHLALFALPEDEFKRWTIPLVLLSPGSHRRALSTPVVRTDEFCLACHHLQLKPSPRSATFRYDSCVSCHMQPSRQLHGAGTWKNHYFPGSNTALPFVTGRKEDLEMMLRWLAGDTILFRRPSVWDLSPGDEKVERQREIWLWMSCELLEPLRPGGQARVKIVTSNVGIGHAFPAAALDLIEVWLEVVGTDGAGRALFHSGWIGEDGKVDSDAHRLGGYMLDENHRILEKNRVWFITKKVTQRLIGAGEDARDEYIFDLPGELSAPVKIVARWSYRKLNPDFVHWAYDGARISMPVAEVGKVEAEFPLVGSEPISSGMGS